VADLIVLNADDSLEENITKISKTGKSSRDVQQKTQRTRDHLVMLYQ
jgi:hypothetical protein